MGRELFKIPLKHLVDCISKDSRFELNCDWTTVRLKPQPTETDSFGFLDNDTKPQYSQTKSLSFLSQIYTQDLELKQRTLPVIYRDGKFYEDDEPKNYHGNYQSFVSVPDYETENIDPLGVEKRAHERACFNCNIPGHSYQECPEPLDREKIKSRRTEKGTAGRLFDEVELIENFKDMVPGKLSRALRYALGMMNEDDEPPYYNNMRIYGYPPGYWGKSFSSLAQIQQDDERFKNLPVLKIFGSEKDTEEESKQSTDYTFVQLVHFPGLFSYYYPENYYDPHQYYPAVQDSQNPINSTDEEVDMEVSSGEE